MTTPPPIERFHKTVIELSGLVGDLIQEIYDSGHKSIDPTLVRFAGIILENYNKKDLIETFIEHSVPHWDLIFARDDKFFLENASQIFQGLPMTNINAFKTLFITKNKDGQPIIQQADKKEIWDFFRSLIKICHHYLHEQRRVIPGLNLAESAVKWEVKFRQI